MYNFLCRGKITPMMSLEREAGWKWQPAKWWQHDCLTVEYSRRKENMADQQLVNKRSSLFIASLIRRNWVDSSKRVSAPASYFLKLRDIWMSSWRSESHQTSLANDQMEQTSCKFKFVMSFYMHKNKDQKCLHINYSDFDCFRRSKNRSVM